jgi:DnaK suppressor protein
MKQHSRSFLRTVRRALELRRAVLSHTVSAERDEVGGEQRAAELEDIGRGAPSPETAVTLLELGEAQLGAVETALGKLDAGAYGRCETCAGEIPEARLRALPLATRCIECQRAAESPAR